MTIQKRFTALACALLLTVGMVGCQNHKNEKNGASPSGESPLQGQAWSFIDALNRSLTIQPPKTVVSLYGSFAETWVLAGGELAGTTADAVEERNMELPGSTQIIGTVKTPDTERMTALNPDFVILSADIASHVQMNDMLTDMQIPHAYFRVDAYQDYLDMLNGFCRLTGRDDLYEKNGAAVERQIHEILQKIPKMEKRPTVLMIRAFSTGAKAKGKDNLGGVILDDLNTDNIVQRHESLLEDLSLEEIIKEDPDFIFVSVMGADDEKALDALKKDLQSNPAWQDLKAVKNDRYIVLPKELFHYKPNAKWGESYAYLARILYPEAMD